MAIFPEGTTSDGCDVLPFRPALFQAAVDHQRGVQPLTLGYRNSRGEPCGAAAFVGDTSFLQSLRRIALAPRIFATIWVLPAQIPRRAPAEAPRGFARRELAARRTDDREAGAERSDGRVDDESGERARLRRVGAADGARAEGDGPLRPGPG